MKYLLLIFCFIFMIACRKDKRIALQKDSSLITDNLSKPDSIKLNTYFNWKESIKCEGYITYDTLAIEKIEVKKDTAQLYKFTTNHPELKELYTFWDDWQQKLLDDLHLVDINGDGVKDIIYNGYSGHEGDVIKIYLQQDNKFNHVFSQYQDIHSLKFDSKGRLISFIVTNPGCCADTQVVHHYYIVSHNGGNLDFRLEKSVGYSADMEVAQHIYETPLDFEIKVNNAKLRTDTYLIDNVKHPVTDNNGNIIAIYPLSTKGKAIASKTYNSITWIKVLLPYKQGFSFYDIDEQKNIAAYTYGWMLKSDIDLAL